MGGWMEACIHVDEHTCKVLHCIYMYMYMYMYLKGVEGLQTRERENGSESFLEGFHLSGHAPHQCPVYHQLETQYIICTSHVCTYMYLDS